MTLLGKIFTVLILILSVLFMGLSMVVYATHTNWKLVVDNPSPTGNQKMGLKQQIEAQHLVNLNLGKERDTILKKLAAEQSGRRYAIAALQSRLDDASARLLELQNTEGKTAGALETSVNNLRDLTNEVAGLRQEIRDAQQAADQSFQMVVEMVDQVNQLRDVERRLNERNVAMGHRISRMLAVLDANGLTEDDDVEDREPVVDGIVLQITGDLVEISIGSDDGLKPGHELDVFRQKSYVGRIRVRRTEPNKAVAQMIPEFKNTEFRKGDRVATKLAS